MARDDDNFSDDESLDDVEASAEAFKDPSFANGFDDDFDEDDFDDDEFDDDDFDDDEPRPVPHPDDRLWRHPSELASIGIPSAAAPTPTFSSNAFGGDDLLDRNVTWRRARPLVATAATVAIIAFGITQLNNVNTPVAQEAIAFPATVSLDTFTGTQLNAAVSEQPDQLAHAASWQNRLRSEVAPMAPTIVALTAEGITTQRGLFLDRDGHVVTTAHGLQGVEAIRVIDESGHELDARIVGADAISDLAVIATTGSFEGTPRPLVASAPRVGDPVLIMGDGQQIETAMGRVSATRQRLDSSATASFFDAITIQAPGAAALPGTPALNDTGSVIGMIATLVPNSAEPQAATLAMIPARTITAVSQAIIKSGGAIWPWIGVELDTTDDPNAGAIGPNTLVTVAAVHRGSPAEHAGLRVGDRITQIDGQPVTSPEMIGRTVQSSAVGNEITLGVDRAGTPVTITATLIGRTDAIVEVTPVPTP